MARESMTNPTKVKATEEKDKQKKKPKKSFHILTGNNIHSIAKDRTNHAYHATSRAKQTLRDLTTSIVNRIISSAVSLRKHEDKNTVLTVNTIRLAANQVDDSSLFEKMCESADMYVAAVKERDAPSEAKVALKRQNKRAAEKESKKSVSAAKE